MPETLMSESGKPSGLVELETPKAAPAVKRLVHEMSCVRFSVTVVASVLRAVASFATGVVIARALGAAQYGDLNFLLGSMAAMNLLLDAGSTAAFYTFISARKRPPVFFAFYLGWTLGVQFIGSLLILGLAPREVMSAIWLGQPRAGVLLAFCGSFAMSQLWVLVLQLGEAARKTLVVQAITVIHAILHLVLVVVFLLMGLLSINMVLLLQFAEMTIIAAIVVPRLIRVNKVPDDGTTFLEVARAFVEYCGPLVVYSIVVFCYSFADRWLLQKYGGAQQQGLFAIGQQFSAIGLLATSAVMNVFWKEVAEARDRQDDVRVRLIYRRVRRAVYITGVWTAALLIPYSREIVSLTVGTGYSEASLPLAMMFFFSIHQSLGQLQGAFFKAMGETKIYMLFGCATLLLSIPVTYLILAPPSAAPGGAGLGSVGLALKLVLLQLVGVSIEAKWLIRRFRLDSDFAFQAVALVAAIAASFATKWAGKTFLRLFAPAVGPSIVFVTGASCFVAITGVLLVAFRRRLGELDTLANLIAAVRPPARKA